MENINVYSFETQSSVDIYNYTKTLTTWRGCTHPGSARWSRLDIGISIIKSKVGIIVTKYV